MLGRSIRGLALNITQGGNNADVNCLGEEVTAYLSDYRENAQPMIALYQNGNRLKNLLIDV
ncbi:hypothetical protein TSMEX_006849 [Taenia solium]|eukprot:TsM_000251100 transcript=TsM_000251100 gene=TsM_000251100